MPPWRGEPTPTPGRGRDWTHTSLGGLRHAWRAVGEERCMVHAVMRTTSSPTTSPENAGVERELAVLVRHLERLGRHSDLYAGMGAAGRAGYLLLMTLEEAGSATIGALAATLGL